MKKVLLAVLLLAVIFIVPQVTFGWDLGGDTYNTYTTNNEGGEGGKATAIVNQAMLNLQTALSEAQAQAKSKSSAKSQANNAFEFTQKIEDRTDVPIESGSDVIPPNLDKGNIYDNSVTLGNMKIGGQFVVWWNLDRNVLDQLDADKYNTYGGMINRWEMYRVIKKTLTKLYRKYPGVKICVKITGRATQKTYAPIPNVGAGANPQSNISSTAGGSFGVNISTADEWNVIEYLSYE